MTALSPCEERRLCFDIPYRYLGTSGRYRPDFLVRLETGVNLLIEGKRRKRERDYAKATATQRWLAAVNNWGELGRWEFAMARRFGDVSAAISAVDADLATAAVEQ